MLQLMRVDQRSFGLHPGSDQQTPLTRFWPDNPDITATSVLLLPSLALAGDMPMKR
jgi:hypothetical protein